MDGIELGKMVGGLGDAYVRGQQAGMEKAIFPMKMGLMEQQQQIGQQQLQSGQIALENQKKIQEYAKRFSEEFKANPSQDPYALKTRIAGELGLPEEVFKGLEEGEKKFKSAFEMGMEIFSWIGAEGLIGWLEKHPELKPVVKVEKLPNYPDGIIVTFPDGTSIKAMRTGPGKAEIIKPTTEGGFTLGPGQSRYGPTGEKIAEGPPKEQGAEETADIKNFQVWNKVPGNEEKTFQDYMMFKAGLNKSGFQIEVDKDGNIRVSQGELGKSDITTTTKGKLQEDTMKLIEQASSMRKIGEDFKRDYLTYWGRIKQYGLNVASKSGADIGTENKEFVGGMRAFVERVEAFYQKWRKEITGAQAVMKEIEMLRESVLNKKVSPDEFEASYNRMMNDIELSLKLKQELMQKGFKGNELGQKIDELFTQRKTQTEIETESNKPNLLHFEDSENDYYIPPDKINKFKQKHPDARQIQ